MISAAFLVPFFVKIFDAFRIFIDARKAALGGARLADAPPILAIPSDTSADEALLLLELALTCSLFGMCAYRCRPVV